MTGTLALQGTNIPAEHPDTHYVILAWDGPTEPNATISGSVDDIVPELERFKQDITVGRIHVPTNPVDGARAARPAGGSQILPCEFFRSGG